MKLELRIPKALPIALLAIVLIIIVCVIAKEDLPPLRYTATLAIACSFAPFKKKHFTIKF